MKQIFDKSNKNVRIVGEMTDDGIKLFLDLFHPVPENLPDEESQEAAPPITKDDVRELLKGEVPLDNLHEGVLSDMIKHYNTGEDVKHRRVIKGVEPRTGADGKILYLVKRLTGDKEVAIDDKGRASYTELHLFDNIRKGQIVARIYPPKAGVNGINIFAQAVPADPGKAIKVSLDKSIVSKQEKGFEVLIANTYGYLSSDGDRLLIKEQLDIQGDIDFKFGNINFIGNVKITGEVKKGFQVEADKGIEILGGVNFGKLICKNGKIVVRGNVRKSQIVGLQDVEVESLQESDLQVYGEVLIHKAALNSIIRSENFISVKEGRLVGGKAFVVNGLEADEIGNEAQPLTFIFLCSDVETHVDYTRLVANIDSHEKVIRLLELHLGPYATSLKKIERLRGAFKEKMLRAYGKMKMTKRSREKLLERKEDLLKERKFNNYPSVKVNSGIFSGTQINAGETVYKPNEFVEGPIIVKYSTDTEEFEDSRPESENLPG